MSNYSAAADLRMGRNMQKLKAITRLVKEFISAPKKQVLLEGLKINERVASSGVASNNVVPAAFGSKRLKLVS